VVGVAGGGVGVPHEIDSGGIGTRALAAKRERQTVREHWDAESAFRRHRRRRGESLTPP
jgi:hypothetical protein